MVDTAKPKKPKKPKKRKRCDKCGCRIRGKKHEDGDHHRGGGRK